MPNSINSLSPSFRDYLLLKNLVTDTVVDNGLQSLLNGIGLPAQTETLPNAVQPSNSIDDTSIVYQESNTILNQFQGTPNDYTQVNIVYNQSNSTITNEGPYNNSNELLTDSDEYRKNNTIKNAYIDEEKQSVINLNTQPVPVFQNLTSYIDENNNLSIGGPSTQAADVLAGIVSGQGVGFGGGGLVANEDIRATLLGRVLGATGVINDTPLGNIGGQQLLAHVGYNAAFGLQQETIGSLNLNPLSLLQGKSLVTLNYSITVPKGTVGRVLNFAANIFGVQSPLSLLEESSSIFSFNNKLEYIGMSNIEKANEMIKNSGMGQVQSLINHMKANTLISNPEGTTLRQGYAPGYKDDRISKGENTGDGVNFRLYARDNGEGGIIDFINGKENSPISSGNYDRTNQIINDGWSEDYRGFYADADLPISEADAELNRISVQVMKYKDAFGWTDSYNNVPENQKDFNQNTLFNNPKTLLYKTRKIFETNRMQTLISGHGVKDDVESQIQSAVSSVGRFVSKGSGVLSYNALLKGVNDDPAKVFCRTWTTYDRYDQVFDLQKNSGLNRTDPNKRVLRRNGEFSVLEDNGFARVAPYKTDKMSGIVDGDKGSKSYDKNTDNKRYMFSIENLAWNDNLVNLLPCEVGPGDTLSGTRGRIMWFPPYDVSFNETTSASWDKHNFIGRGEPMYTYNNTERNGTLTWKIIIDHPNYLNFMGTSEGINLSNYDDFVASYFAGCIPYERINSVLTVEEIAKTEVKNKQKEDVEKLEPVVVPTEFDVYFPNDVYDIELYDDYENGLQVGGTGTTSGDTIDYKTNPTGSGFGIEQYTEMCYQFTSDGKKVWSSQQCTKSNGPEGAPGRLEPDRTNFGLNATGSTSTTGFKPIKLGDKKYKSWRDPEYHKDLQDYLLTKCKSCKIEVVGFASTVGTFGDDRNDTLSKLRAENIKKYLLDNIITNPPFTERVNVVADGKGATETASAKCNTPNAQARKQNYLESKNDEYGCKANRYVTVKFVNDSNLKVDEKPKTENEVDKTENIITPSISPGRFYSECDYFEKLEIDSPTVFKTLREKIKYFQPAFHSTTPEGFNSRLTFLQQCMRQGPTLGAGDTNNPNNLAFGRPPVSILRIGDFYHTKIIIENLSFSFEPLVWDLNPEGVGVQPMICNVDMSFSFIGGSSLQGPINKLQNAVSFNYFANTEIYDLRSDTIVIKDGVGKIVDGEKSFINSYDVTDAETQGKGRDVPRNQIAQSNNANAGDQPLGPATGSTSGLTTDNLILQNAKLKTIYKLDINLNNGQLSGTFQVGGELLSKEYNAIIKVVNPDGGNLDVATFKLGPIVFVGDINFGGFQTSDGGWDIVLKSLANSNDAVNFVVEIPEFKSIKFYDVRAIASVDCPGENIKTGQMIDYSDWSFIKEDFCCSCYPSGTGNQTIIFNGVTCSPTSGCT